MSGTGRDGDNRARGNRHTVGKGERAQRKTVRGNWERAENGSVFHIWVTEEGIQRTAHESTKPQALPEEAIYLVHLIHPSLRPAFFPNHSIDLFPEGFEIFGIGKKAVQKLCGSLWASND